MRFEIHKNIKNSSPEELNCFEFRGLNSGYHNQTLKL